MQDDLDDLGVVVAGEPDRPQGVLVDMAALADDLRGKRHGGVGLGVVGMAGRLAAISASSSFARFLAR